MGCTSQEGKSPSSGELSTVKTAQQNRTGKSAALEQLDSLFDPGPFKSRENEGVDAKGCAGEVESFTWNSGELNSSAIDRQIITANGYLESAGMRLEVSWSRHKVQRQWSGFEKNDSFKNWKTWLDQPLLEGGATLSGSMKSKLTVIHTDGCQRSGFPVQTEAWTRLNAWVLSQIQSVDSASNTGSLRMNHEVDPSVESGSRTNDSLNVRGQVAGWKRRKTLSLSDWFVKTSGKNESGCGNGRAVSKMFHL